MPMQAVTRNELYGYLHPATREWKEGLMSVTYRDMANNRTNKHQWIVLDGDIDAEWIEVCLLHSAVSRENMTFENHLHVASSFWHGKCPCNSRLNCC